MWRVGLRELQWRKRRVFVALLATSLVLALTLLLSGASAGINSEASRVTRTQGADGWIVADGVSGPFTASRALPESRVAEVAALEGVRRAWPLVSLRATMRQDDEPRIDVNVLGLDDQVSGPGRVIADTRLGLSVGDVIAANGLRLVVEAERGGLTFNFGTPTLIVSVADAQQIGFGGQPGISAVLTEGMPSSVPDGLDLLTDADVTADLHRVAKSAAQTVDFINYLLWIVAAGIVASVVYVSVLERTRDLAVFKATGATNRGLFLSIVMEAVPLTLVATIIAVGLSRLLRAGFPFAVELKASHVGKLFVFGLAAGLISGLVGLRRAAKTDPALAFRGAS